MITTQLKNDAAKSKGLLQKIGEALHKNGNNSADILEKLGELGEVGSKVFAVIGVIQVLTGTDEMSQLKNQLNAISDQIKTGFSNLNAKLDQEFADVQIKPAMAGIDAAWNFFQVYSTNETDVDSINDVKNNIDSNALMTNVTTIINAVTSDGYFNKIHKYSGNSPDIMLKISLNFVSAVCRACTALVAHAKLNDPAFTSSSSTQTEKDAASERIANHYATVFSKNNKSYISIIKDAVTTQINTFNEDTDIHQYFINNWTTEMNLTANDYEGNCQKIVNFLNKNYPSRTFHAFITDEPTNMPYRRVDGDMDKSFGYANMNTGIKVFNLYDTNKVLGTDAVGGKFYLTVVHSYNQCSDPNAISNRNYVSKAFSSNPNSNGTKLDKDHSRSNLNSKNIAPVCNDSSCNGPHPWGDVINDYTDGNFTSGSYIDWAYTISSGFIFVGKRDNAIGSATYFRATASAPSSGGNDPNNGAVWYSKKISNEWYSTSSSNLFLFWMARTA